MPVRQRQEIQEVSRQQIEALRRWGPSLATGLLYGFSFPPFRTHLFAWFALTPLLCSLTDGEAAKKPFRNGFLSFFIADLIIFYWLWPTFQAARINTPTTFICWLALSAIVALYGGAFARFYVSVPWPAARPWLAAAAWVALDEVRTAILTGFPWALFSHTQARYTPVIQLASLTGAPGVTFLIVLANGAITEGLRSAGRKNVKRSAALALVLVLGAVVGGQWRLSRAAARKPERVLNVSLLQGSIDQYRKWDDAYEADIRNTYGRISTDARDSRPDLIVWPETAVPGWVPSDPFYVAWVGDVIRKSGAPHIFGALSGTDKQSYNAAIFATADGKLVDQYNKRHLVPFGEYVPVGGFLKGVIPYLGQVGLFAPGKGTVHFRLGDFRLAPNICYEAMFPALIRDEARGADAIVNITNDGWFLKTGAPEQHFVVNILRAVENGRPVFRAANSGISAFIDAYGRVPMESHLMDVGAFTYPMPIPNRDFRTLFAIAGNWFGWLCFLVAAAWTALVALKRGPR